MAEKKPKSEKARWDRILTRILETEPKLLAKDLSHELEESFREVNERIKAVREEIEGGGRPRKQRFTP